MVNWPSTIRTKSNTSFATCVTRLGIIFIKTRPLLNPVFLIPLKKINKMTNLGRIKEHLPIPYAQIKRMKKNVVKTYPKQMRTFDE